MATAPCEVGIVGSGIIGLTTALCLSRAGYRVAIIARELPGDESLQWASPWGGAGILLVDTKDENDRQMQLNSFKCYWTLAHEHPKSGVQKVKVVEYWDETEPSDVPWFAPLLPDYRVVPKEELPPGVLGGHTFVTLSVDPEVLLPWLKDQLVTLYSVPIIRGEIVSLNKAKSRLQCRLLVNASGLGAEKLAGDDEVIGIRGQTLLVKYPETTSSRAVRDLFIRRGKEYTYVIPRISGLVLGGIQQPGSTSTKVDTHLREDILRRVNILTRGKFQSVEIIRDIVGFRPGRTGGYRVESDRQHGTIHAYGFGGAGYRYSFGAAQRVLELVEAFGRARL